MRSECLQRTAVGYGECLKNYLQDNQSKGIETGMGAARRERHLLTSKAKLPQQFHNFATADCRLQTGVLEINLSANNKAFCSIRRQRR
jgi:hypothetical protein